MSKLKIQVEKRDGTIVEFERKRIINAITKANTKVNDDFLYPHHINEIADTIEKNISGKDYVSVEQIQDMVIKNLITFSPKVASAYSEYREKRNHEREKKSPLHTQINKIVFNPNDPEFNENANKDSNLTSTQRDLVAGAVSKWHAISELLPKNVANAHVSGDIHFHDADYSPLFGIFNCMLVDLDNMLTYGYTMGNAPIESPKSISVACAQTAQIIAQVASNIYGGTSIHRIDDVLAPYVRLSFEKHKKIGYEVFDEISNSIKDHKDESERKRDDFASIYAKKRTEKETYDAFQALEYEVNTLHTSNGQTPFVTFNFGLSESWEGRLIQKAILKVRLKGLGSEGHTAIFPKLVFTIRKGVNFKEGELNYDIKQLALKCAAKRMYPDILSYDKIVEITGSYKSPMGCRSFLSSWKNEEGEEIVNGRNNLGVVSVNLPRLAIRAKNGEGIGETVEERFFNLLSRNLSICYDGLMVRIDRLREVRAKDAPILYQYGAMGVRLEPDDKVFHLFENGRATISLGYVGLHETIMALTDKHIFEDKGGKDLSLTILQTMKNACNKWKDETGFGFSLYSTPAESLCHRFAKLDVEKYGEMEGVNDHHYYTNSFHLDVSKKVSPFEKIDFEKAYPYITSAGFIQYVEFPSMRDNLQALEETWDYALEHTAYFGTNTPVDLCNECNHNGEMSQLPNGSYECPNCGNKDSSKMDIVRRTCGYLGAPAERGFNKGKNIEVARRTKSLEE